MGYRHYFYEVSKAEVEKIKGLSKDQLICYMKENYPDKVDEDGWISFHDIADQKEIFEFGKLYYEDTAKQIYDTGKPLFDNQETQEQYSDYEPYVVGKEGLLKAIEIYKSKIISYYKSLLEDNATQILPFGIEVERNIPKETKWEKHIKDMLSEWANDFAVDTNESEEYITKSWKYEYETFELARLLKTINWNEKTILFYGW